MQTLILYTDTGWLWNLSQYGGIMCITPRDAVEKVAVTKRLEKVPSAACSAQAHKVKLQTYIVTANGISGTTIE